MKKVFFYILVILTTTGCEHKELCDDHTHTADLKVFFDWTDAPDATPETMSLYLFPVNGSNALRYEFTNQDGGTITVPAGCYDALCLNSDTEKILFRNINHPESFEIYTREADLLAGLGIKSTDFPKADGAQGEKIVMAPDMLWSDSDKSIEVLPGISGQDITLKPSRAIRSYTVEIRNAENLKYVKDISGSLSGMSGGLMLDNKAPTEEAATIPFDATITSDMSGISGGLLSFGPAAAQDGRHKLVIYSVLETGEKWYYTYDVTNQICTAPDPYNVHIVLDGLPLPEPMVNGGGFRPGVDGWNEIYIDIIL